ncbi:MAG TPA: ribonuclease P protein component [Cyanobacteria bacterium UBA12227]|nr:ribonuclease P protein component [Cyanobacteria bacterium UBA12227]HAX90372.1 ribonuclease P protein component [Cyanobacteria bacterium UBA11370]HBY76196.1 ribonuclease P protein component [Cyanobacteria bacterium UBA11148]
MLPKANRLRHWRDFQVIYRQGIRRSGHYLTLRGRRQLSSAKDMPILVTEKGHSDSRSQQRLSPCLSNKPVPKGNGKSPTCIGISISQKVSKKAVVRNRIKRQIRAALRQLLPRLSLGWQLVVVVRPTALECDYAQFLQELEQLLVEAEVIHGH